MRDRLVLLWLLLGALLVLPRPADAAPRVGSVCVRGSLIGAYQPLSDLAKYTDICRERYEAARDELGSGFTVKDAGLALGVEAEVAYRFSRLFSVGVGCSYARQAVKCNGSFVGSTIEAVHFPLPASDQLTATVTDVTGGLTVWVPAAPGFFAGVQAGVAFGRLEETAHMIMNDSGSFTGSGFSGGVFTGYTQEIARGLSAHAKLGYRLQNLGSFTGRYDSDPPGEQHEFDGWYAIRTLPVKVTFDFSGPYAGCGFAYSFGGH